MTINGKKVQTVITFINIYLQLDQWPTESLKGWELLKTARIS